MQLGIPELLIIAFALGLIAFWLWMLVDCATKESPGTPRFAWLILIALVGVVGAPLYFLLRKLPRKATR